MSAEALRQLRERVAGLTGESREVDAAIGDALGEKFRSKNFYKRGHYVGHEPVLLRVERRYPLYTASIDAALALMKRCLPGWKPKVAQEDDNLWRAHLGAGSRGTASASGPTGPLAILLALLDALISQEPSE